MLLKKCVAFTGDNYNTMFGGLGRNEQGNNVFAKLKKMLNPSLIGGWLFSTIVFIMGLKE